MTSRTPCPMRLLAATLTALLAAGAVPASAQCTGPT